MMRFTRAMALSAALGAGLFCAGQAQAQDFGRDFDQLRSDRAGEGQTLSLRWSTTLGSERTSVAQGPRLALQLSRADAGGDVNRLDVVSYAFNGADNHLQTPFTFNAANDGEGGWLSSTRNKVLFGVGAALLIWGVIELADDDKNDSGTGCTSTSRC
jgi:hypothetical protein